MQRVAVLVDEYDKPILDALETPEAARANRDYLRGLYGVIKDSDAHVRFTFLTGISKFSKVNLFSQLNNLTDITLDRVYSSICGYTEGDLDTVFAAELAGLDRERVREWYNGYSWRGTEKVYNPYDVLLLLRRGEFERLLEGTGERSHVLTCEEPHPQQPRVAQHEHQRPSSPWQAEVCEVDLCLVPRRRLEPDHRLRCGPRSHRPHVTLAPGCSHPRSRRRGSPHGSAPRSTPGSPGSQATSDRTVWWSLVWRYTSWETTQR